MGVSHGAPIFPCLAWRLVAGGCVLPLTREGFQPAAVTAGPQNKLIMANAAGMLLFADLDDFTIQEDVQFSQGSKDSNIQGLTMTSPESTYLYLGAAQKSQVLEYEWHSSHRVFRTFNLLGLPRDAASEAQHLGLQSLTFVPTPASSQEGYFYASTGISGDVYIYEVPLLSEGAVQSASSVKLWSPLASTAAAVHHVEGMAYADGHLFLCYTVEDSTRLLIFQVLASGLPGRLREQHQLDVQHVADLAVRKSTEEEWQMFFICQDKRNVYGYAFRFLEGFRLHPYCEQDFAPHQNDAGVLPKMMALAVGSFWWLLMW